MGGWSLFYPHEWNWQHSQVDLAQPWQSSQLCPDRPKGSQNTLGAKTPSPSGDQPGWPLGKLEWCWVVDLRGKQNCPSNRESDVFLLPGVVDHMTFWNQGIIGSSFFSYTRQHGGGTGWVMLEIDKSKSVEFGNTTIWFAFDLECEHWDLPGMICIPQWRIIMKIVAACVNANRSLNNVGKND